MARYLYSELSSLIQARKNCLDKEDYGVNQSAQEWANKHEDKIEELVKDHMPSGSGFDNGTKIDLDASHAEKLVFIAPFHHMNDGGFYSGWTDHTITVTPSLASGFHLRISGRNRNDIKEYASEMFSHALTTDVEWDIQKDWPVVAERGLEIKSEWVKRDNSDHLRFYVVCDGVEVFTPSDDAKTYQGSPLEQCRAFAVSQVNFLRLGTR